MPDPILGDKYAEQAMRHLDPDYDKHRFGTSQLGLAAVVRAKVYDDWTRGFLADHPDAVVLNLGCGLDARLYRIGPPAAVDWYDLDYPSVIELRQQILPPREHSTLIGSSVTELTWLESVPHDRPVLMIAEGLVPYLTEAEARRLLTGVVDSFPNGQMLFDTVSVS
ncbi:MAG TPA: class I SAM-dependent methyltransferase, partial [Candidatus Limnocylindrales bacterium]